MACVLLTPHYTGSESSRMHHHFVSLVLVMASRRNISHRHRAHIAVKASTLSGALDPAPRPTMPTQAVTNLSFPQPLKRLGGIKQQQVVDGAGGHRLHAELEGSEGADEDGAVV